MTIMSADTERLSAAISRRVRAIAARFRRPAKPKGVVKERLNKLDGFSGTCQGNAGLPANWPILLLNIRVAQNRRKLTSIKFPVAKL